jgi:tryptophan synthase alpha chain
MSSPSNDRVREMFERTRAEGRPALIPFVPGGWPERDATVEIVQAAVDAGADAFEIGMPFSDPLADGVTNQRAYQQSLENGFSVADLFSAVRELRRRDVRVPLLVMGYFNPLLAYGLGKFVQDAVSAGIDGLIPVDLPPEEADELEPAARAAGLHVMYLLAPTSTNERIGVVAEHGSGFIYCVSVTGVTGARAAVSDQLPAFLERVRAQTELPLAVGFGISAREHVEEVGRHADAAVIGGAFVETIANASREQRPDAIRAFVEEMSGRGT